MPEGTRDASRCGSPALGIQLQAVHRCNEVATEPVKEGHVHIPDGFINASTSLGAGAVAAGGLGVSLRRTAQTLQDKQGPLAGLVAAYIFAVQMLNFPVAAGTSGHLLGGVLAAVLVGPWAGAICVAVVLLVQALFADGGLTALGLNIANMALVGGIGGYAVFMLLRKVLPASKSAVAGAAGVAAGISVVLASIAFVVEYAIGGAGGASVGTVAAAMVGVHTLIGVGEGIITALTVGVVLGVRPDLVHGAADLQAPLVLEAEGVR
jgi:cobalt/nickel transport system permease protein